VNKLDLVEPGCAASRSTLARLNRRAERFRHPRCARQRSAVRDRGNDFPSSPAGRRIISRSKGSRASSTARPPPRPGRVRAIASRLPRHPAAKASCASSTALALPVQLHLWTPRALVAKLDGTRRRRSGRLHRARVDPIVADRSCAGGVREEGLRSHRRGGGEVPKRIGERGYRLACGWRSDVVWWSNGPEGRRACG